MDILAFPAFANEKINPYNALLYKHAQKNGLRVIEYTHKRALFSAYDVLHYHWPDGYINAPARLKMLQRAAVLVLIVLIAKARRKKIIWTVHNLFPHDAFYPRTAFAVLSWFARHCDGLIFLSEGGTFEFNNHYAGVHAKKAIIPHGHYRPIYPALPSRDAARRMLNLPPDKTVLLSFGLIKQYKNMDGLLDAFLSLDDPDIFLLIAGHCKDQTLAQRLGEKAKKGKNIRLDLKFIEDSDLPFYFAAADMMVLSYHEILNSGALLLSLSLNVPVLAPRRSSFLDLQKMVGSSWLSLYDGAFNAATLRTALNAQKSNKNGGVCDLSALDWQPIGEKLAAFYKNL
jgi:glycosyltransferase involved in cell wall biosynthesis